MRGSGRPRSARGGGGSRSPPAPRNKRGRAPRGRGAGARQGKLSEGPGRRREGPGPPRRGAPHNSRAAHGKPGRHAPARRPGLPAYLVVLLPAARGRRRPARAARHVHVQGAGERAPQRPHPPRQPHGRQAQAQPARQQSHRGPQPLAPITAGAAARRRRGRRLRSPPPPPGLEPSRPTCPSSPCRAEAGVGRSGAGGAQLPTAYFRSARGTPPPAAPVSTRSTDERPGRVLAGTRSLLPTSRPAGRRDKGSARSPGARLVPSRPRRRIPAEMILIAFLPKTVTEASRSLRGGARWASGLSLPYPLLLRSSSRPPAGPPPDRADCPGRGGASSLSPVGTLQAKFLPETTLQVLNCHWLSCIAAYPQLESRSPTPTPRASCKANGNEGEGKPPSPSPPLPLPARCPRFGEPGKLPAGRF